MTVTPPFSDTLHFLGTPLSFFSSYCVDESSLIEDHAWTFSGDGRCAAIPQAPSPEQEARLRADDRR